ncbi:MAG: toxin-antitoxin system HicB family antitoxin [Streptosporangiaceae bacterium]
MSCVTCSPTWLHPASRFRNHCRSADIRAGSWFVVRVPAEVHRRLAREAAEQHVSLNRLVSDRLARA